MDGEGYLPSSSDKSPLINTVGKQLFAKLALRSQSVNNRMLKMIIQQGPRERNPRSVLEYVRRFRDRERSW
jgi:hypothetical protein